MASSPQCKDVKLNIFQWNARSIKPKLKSFEYLLFKEKVHIAVVSETWLIPEIHVKLRDYSVFRRDRDVPYGGIAVLCHKSIQAKLDPINVTHPGIETIRVQLFNCNDLKYIVGIYCPSDIITSQSDWNDMFSMVSSKTLILGDFNAHHLVWSYKTDTRGRQIVNCLDDNDNLILLNSGSATRFQMVEGTLRESSPDLSLISSDVALHFDWSVTLESLGSDHRIIRISAAVSSLLRPITKRNFKRADWEKYKMYLEKIFEDFDVPVDIQNAYDKFLEYLNNAADRFIPIVMSKSR